MPAPSVYCPLPIPALDSRAIAIILVLRYMPTPPAYDQRTATALKLYVVLARATRAVEDHIARDIAEQGLTPAEFGALEALWHKGPMLLGELQRSILV